jgi:pilus assembly protein CpaE
MVMVDAEKTRVLIVDDIAETRENVRKLLQFESDIEVVASAQSAKEAIQLTKETEPDVVLMDINMPDMDGITATETIRQQSPTVQVVILSVQEDQIYMRRAMLAGARDFLPKPPMPDELVAAIRRAGKMAHEERAKVAQTVAAVPTAGPQNLSPRMGGIEGKIIVVYSPKGGTGRTTIAVNLAVTLANDETRVVIVDANLQFGDVAIFMKEQGKNTVLDLAPRVDELEPSVVEENMIKHEASGVHILASPSQPEYGDKISADQFTKLLQYLRHLYAYVVVDTITHLDDLTLSILDIADAIILVTTQEVPSVKNNILFLNLLQTLNIPSDKVALVVNKFDRRIAISAERIGENLKQELSAVIPLDEKIVIPSVIRGIPFMIDNKTQPSARGIFSLAESIRAKLVKAETPELDKSPKGK